ncbi:hypothetical protein LO762_28380 [Actinocorallia sp. API 0066]|uniref:hypothetical protein n=1 Tax=Actinocorallia sp. API 0066 TaxID=2896846 RepID=UPI001E2D7A4F|nr:hypothetical protein [Actinocorallia sp. API 0066]MCD0453070.1 hypothetical protein [Actinocorallia sp. API 0066]
MNPLTHPTLVYLRTALAVRVERVRSREQRSVGASAVEWAIITGLLAVIAIAIGLVIQQRIEAAANAIDTGF